ncbi:MAG: hypothetical protein HQ582_09895 [Planctomycetes bacterium]|nr:hypothetical protein [Planctomycetota bacterium]
MGIRERRARRKRGPRFLGFALSVVLVWVGSLSDPGWLDRARAGEEKRAGDDRAKDEGETRLDGMRRRAQATKVYRLDDGTKTAVKLLPGPLYRFSDQPRRIPDATLWGWGTEGRPVALHSIQFYRRPGRPNWFQCLVSFSEGLVEAQWPDGPRWSADKPGLLLRALPDAPAAADKQFGRLLQMKSVARRFSVTIFDNSFDVRNTQEEMRLLSQPICRYSHADSGLQDGAFFALVDNGASPDLMLVIELHGKELSDSVWKYALVRMTTEPLSVRLDQKQVWSVPKVHVRGYQTPTTFDSWMFFIEVPRAKGTASDSLQ